MVYVAYFLFPYPMCLSKLMHFKSSTPGMGKGPRNIIKTARLETSDIALEIFIDD
jgi:hypothetical protein